MLLEDVAEISSFVVTSCDFNHKIEVDVALAGFCMGIIYSCSAQA